MHKQSAQLALMFDMHSQFTSLVAGRSGGGNSENSAAQQGMQACTQHLLGNAEQGSSKGTALLMAPPADKTPEKKPKKNDARKREIELCIHKGIVAGEIEPEEGEEGNSEKILELLADINVV
ncbi:hypothetical protein CYMTET_42429 [Cymbomonas tetramitiformis]|uniref:Uncharacterized protein n=1 Tax=Cymbomonas tetramitiformis TaxID=36881 RepID=A0AAE0F1I9_9CHLO|nr:hypothetical protein CYMTET_42429 [Cymbomonas tetramitiformis]